MNKTIKKLKPVHIIILGFMLVIAIGTVCLNLPIASNDGVSIGLIDALFTATSAVCVTGLVVANTLSQWTVFGKIIILILIQIGGLGFMTVVTLILLLVGKKITLKERIMIQESLNQNSLEGMVKLVRRILFGTLIFESIGAVLLSFIFVPDFGLARGIGMGIFHSVSAFCNAGFDIVGDSGMMPYYNNVILNVIIMILVICGGIGYTVWHDILQAIKRKRANSITLKRTINKLSLHTKIVLITTLIMIFWGWILFFICEFNNPLTMGDMTIGEKILASLFQSVTTRTAGFHTVDQGGLTYASKLISILFMFVGGSPAGTAGGIKTTTIAIIIISVMSIAKGRTKISIMERSVPFPLLQKSLAVFFISFGSLVIITLLLTFTEQTLLTHFEFLDVLFETTSAIGTVGLSTGFTPTLSNLGRIIVSIGMFLGRLGPITVVVALAKKHNTFSESIDYPEEKIMVG